MKRAALLVVALLSISGTASAQSKKQRARSHFQAGLHLLDGKHYARALGEFRAAYALWNNPKILLDIGTTLRQLKRDAEAANAYARYLKSPDADPAKTAAVERALADIDAKVGRLRIQVSEPGARVLVDGTTSAEWRGDGPLRVDPGTHTVVARKPGSVPAVATVSVTAGEVRSVKLELVAQQKPAPQPGQQAPQPGQPPEPAAPRTTKAPVDRGVQPGARHAPGPLGVFVRADIDGKGRGAVIAPGASYRFGRYFQLEAAGLIGRDKGGWIGARGGLLSGTFEPSLLIAVPVFVVQGPRVGVQGAAGLAWNASARFAAFVDVGVAHFFSPPPHYDATVFVPSAGVRARL